MQGGAEELRQRRDLLAASYLGARNGRTVTKNSSA
jgi:hypothetical protein